MEKVKTKVNMDSLKRNAENFDIVYDSKYDTLYAHLKNSPPAISVDCDGIFWLRVNPENGEIVGVEIEAYRKSFLKKYKDLKHEKPITSKYFADKLSSELVGCLS
jgi:uncharacterized protein YuzE